MSNVDQIIKYLDNAMTMEEARSFEQELASNEKLKAEFGEVSAAFRLIRDQLQKRDEDSFRAKLKEVMERPVSNRNGKSISKRSNWYLLISLAASLAIVLTVFLINRNGERIMARFYHPEKDPVVLAFNQGSRGKTESAIAWYQKGDFQKTMEIMSEVLDHNPENQMALLYYLLASIELDQESEALKRIATVAMQTDHQAGQSVAWYTALALVKSECMEEAVTKLQPLIELSGPYQRDAKRLQKVLLK